MTYSNFTNGALVLRVWKFDGDTEVLSKHQYMDHAEMMCRALIADDESKGRYNDKTAYFYLAVCENECRARAFGTEKAA